MTLRRLNAFAKVWRRSPPASEMLVIIGKVLGIDIGKADSKPKADAMEALMTALPHGGTLEKVMSMQEYLERRSGRSG